MHSGVPVLSLLVALGVAPAAQAGGGDGDYAAGPGRASSRPGSTARATSRSAPAATCSWPRPAAAAPARASSAARAGVHGRDRRGDEDRPLGPPVRGSRRASPRWRTRPDNDNAIGPHGIMVLGNDRVLITNGGPTEPKDADGATDLRARRSPPRTRSPSLFGRVAADRPARTRDPASPTSGTSSATSTPTRTAGNPAVDSNPVDLLQRRRSARRRRRRRQRARHGRPLRPRREPRGLPEPRRRRTRSAGPADPDAGGADVGREGPGRPVLRQPAHRLPVPGRRREHLPRQPAHAARADRVRDAGSRT